MKKIFEELKKFRLSSIGLNIGIIGLNFERCSHWEQLMWKMTMKRDQIPLFYIKFALYQWRYNNVDYIVPNVV